MPQAVSIIPSTCPRDCTFRMYSRSGHNSHSSQDGCACQQQQATVTKTMTAVAAIRTSTASHPSPPLSSCSDGRTTLSVPSPLVRGPRCVPSNGAQCGCRVTAAMFQITLAMNDLGENHRWGIGASSSPFHFNTTSLHLRTRGSGKRACSAETTHWRSALG
ncbi:hypothetical protein LY78DRAFT_184791 [Colletotrichum sublineola]|nr:hypothetical protein LY78DRAFT_184791 [Colletotrichum sublineola]